MAAWLASTWRENWPSILVIVGLALAFGLLRSSPTELASIQAFDDRVAGADATVAYFYSNT